VNGDPLIRAGEAINAIAIGEEKSAGIVLIARLAERYALGLAFDDEAKALVALLG
jgi:hypothetical protein